MNLQSVRIPPRLRGDYRDLSPAQVFDLRIEGARVQRIRPGAGPARGTLISAMVDAHVHLDKTYTEAEVGAASGDLRAAIARSGAHRAHWRADDLRARMERALADAWSHGTRAMRTHLDWVEAEPPLALSVFEELRALWRGRVELQLCALVPLDLWLNPGAAGAVAGRVAACAQHGTCALGAFVYRNDALHAKLDRLFAVAAEFGLPLDFHVDEGLEPEAVGLAAIAERAANAPVPVVCGHACSLSVQPWTQAEQTLRRCAQAGVHLIALPTTNLYLQGDWSRTPVERGITRIKEAAALGMRPSVASDNVADPFYPYGSYDLIETFGLAVQMAHLAPAADWLDTVTLNPARAIGLPWDGTIAEQCPADLVWLDAQDDHALLTPTGRRRRVMRAGAWI